MNLTDPWIPMIGMANLPSTGGVHILTNTDVAQATRIAGTPASRPPCPMQDFNRSGAVIIPMPLEVTPAPTCGPYSSVLCTDEEYLHVEDEARVMGAEFSFRDSEQPAMPKHLEIAAFLRIKKKADRYVKELNASDLIILLREGK